jgi:hypothetical protein
MSNGDEADDAPADTGEEEAADAGEEAAGTGEEEAADAGDDGATERSPDSLSAGLDDAEERLEAAETEADLDAVEADLDEIAADLEAADLPEPDDEDEDDPAAELQSRLEDLQSDLEEARGPYASDVTERLESAESTIVDAEWTDDGERDAIATVEDFLDETGEILGTTFDLDEADLEAAAASVADVRETVADADLDPDADADTIASLREAATTLEDDLAAAEVWSDLTIREQLDAQGFYDVIDPQTRRDFPPEWNAIRLYASQGESEPILTALERYESDFMEENILDALERFAPPEAYDAMEARAERRNKHAIRVLGRIGDDRACDTIEEFLGGGDVALELVTLRALAAIGNEDSVQAVADRLVAENAEIRSTAARALGSIGDTRAVDPLADLLADDDADEVRASAAWALRQIGTEDALDAAAAYADDRSYIVQSEAEKATGA